MAMILWADGHTYVCQISRTKGTCLEKEEVFRKPGSHLYQRKVTVVGLTLRCQVVLAPVMHSSHAICHGAMLSVLPHFASTHLSVFRAIPTGIRISQMVLQYGIYMYFASL
jgi:hypothetical protein